MGFQSGYLNKTLDFYGNIYIGMVKILKNKNTVLIIFLFIASIAGGMLLKNVLKYSMIIGVSLTVIFLLVAAFSLGKENKERNSSN